MCLERERGPEFQIPKECCLDFLSTLYILVELKGNQ